MGKENRMKNHDLFKFADIVSDVIVDYINGETGFNSDREVLKYIESMCINTMTEESK